MYFKPFPPELHINSESSTQYSFFISVFFLFLFFFISLIHMCI
jgi:hypothetical protein